MTAEEEEEVRSKVAAELPAKEAKQVEEILTSWHKRGMEEGLIRGRMEGQCELLLRLARKRFGFLPAEMEERIKSLSLEELELLAEEMLSFTELAELERRLSRLEG